MPLSASSSSASAPSNPIFRDAKNDIVLKGSDGISFRFRRLHLESASVVFETMLSDGRSDGPRKRTGDGLDIVNLAEDSTELEALLRFIHPQANNPRLEEFGDLVKMVEIADKYEARSILLAVLAQGERFLPSEAPELLALALIYHPDHIAAAALRAFDGEYRQTMLSAQEYSTLVPRWTTNSIPEDLYDRLPVVAQKHLAKLQVSILSPAGRLSNWQRVATALGENPRILEEGDFHNWL